MSDDSYSDFQQRNARRFAELEALEAEVEEMKAARSRSQIVQRSAGELVYKTRHDALQPRYESEQHDDATLDDWNAWADAKVLALAKVVGERLDETADAVNAVTKNLEKAILDEREKRVKLAEALDLEREKATKMRGELEVLRIMVRSQNIGTNMRSRKNVT